MSYLPHQPFHEDGDQSGDYMDMSPAPNMPPRVRGGGGRSQQAFPPQHHPSFGPPSDLGRGMGVGGPFFPPALAAPSVGFLPPGQQGPPQPPQPPTQQSQQGGGADLGFPPGSMGRMPGGPGGGQGPGPFGMGPAPGWRGRGGPPGGMMFRGGRGRGRGGRGGRGRGRGRGRDRIFRPMFRSYRVQENCRFHITDRYQLQGVIGSGAYGTVCSAFDQREQRRVAIKKAHDVFTRSREYQKRIFREIKILEHFNHENVIRLVDLIPAVSFAECTDVYFVLDLMDTDMRTIINSNQPITDEHIQFFMWQLLKGVKCLHSASVLHRDIKPENILLNGDCDLKICDFGLARGVDFDSLNPVMSTPYVATRYYRAPELLLMWNKCSKAIDMWSCGCILGELMYRKPLFPGRNYLHQLNLILRVLGTPHPSHVRGCLRAKQYLAQLPLFRKVPFGSLFPQANPMAVDLLEKMLHFDPLLRISVGEALEHPYLATFHDPAEEPVARSPFDFSFENLIQRKDIDLKKVVYDEIVQWNVRENGYSL